jgi:hypothetical protein
MKKYFKRIKNIDNGCDIWTRFNIKNVRHWTPPIISRLQRTGVLCWNFRTVYGGLGRGLTYRPARQHRLAESIPWNRFLGLLKVKKIPSLSSKQQHTPVINRINAHRECATLSRPYCVADWNAWVGGWLVWFCNRKLVCKGGGVHYGKYAHR